MRVPLETIQEEGERISIYSKFYIWNNMLFEPSLYRGKPTKSYKPVTNVDRIIEVLKRYNEIKEIPTVSSILPSYQKSNKSTFKHKRYNILDFSGVNYGK